MLNQKIKKRGKSAYLRRTSRKTASVQNDVCEGWQS